MGIPNVSQHEPLAGLISFEAYGALRNLALPRHTGPGQASRRPDDPRWCRHPYASTIPKWRKQRWSPRRMASAAATGPDPYRIRSVAYPIVAAVDLIEVADAIEHTSAAGPLPGELAI
jgi:hypothetical protein